jgi:uncharacterized membrane protein YfcA
VSPTTIALLIVLGVAVGLFGTLVGAGGGFILTPILLLVYPEDSPATITAISLVVVFFNALSGSAAYARQRRIDYRAGVAFAAATFPGAVAGALLVAVAPRRLFDALMAALLAGVAAWLLAGARRRAGRTSRTGGQPRELTDRAGATYHYAVPMVRGVAFSLLVGFISSFLGIGGGVLHVPLLIGALGFPVHVATATSHFVLANMAAVGTVTHILAGNFSGGTGLRRAAALSIGVVVGAQVGALLSRRVHGVVIQRLLAAALVAIAVRLLVAVL